MSLAGMSYESISLEMIGALTDEINAVKEGSGGREIPIYDGFKAGTAAGQHLYNFALEYEVTVPDDAPAILKVSSATYDVTVVTTEGFEITLSTSQDLGIRVPLASLNVAPYFLLERLRDRLTEATSRRLKVNRDMSLRLFDQSPNITLPSGPEPDFRTTNESPEPNQEQKASVRQALSQAITFIWGPPGTGKTTTVNYLVPCLLKREERVLITSYTNVAVDQVLKAAKKGMSEQKIRDGTIIRLGHPKDPGDNQDILLEEVVKRNPA